MPRVRDLTGIRFGRLTAMETVGPIRPGCTNYGWRCRCECGTIVVVAGGHLTDGGTQSCGCLVRERTGARFRKHGLRKHPIYHIWNGMKNRCLNPRASDYPRYGGRGIRICESWLRDFTAFLADVGERPSLVHTLDRIDNNGDYEPGNVRWATPKEQRHNRRPGRVALHGTRSRYVRGCRCEGCRQASREYGRQRRAH